MRFGKVTNSRFVRDQRGATAIIFGLVLIPVIGIMGLAIDGWRAVNASTAAAGALDAAALAAAKGIAEENLTDAEAEDQARNYFNANFKSGAHGVSLNGLQVSTDSGTRTVTVTADFAVETTFSKIFHVNQFAMNRAATATYDSRDLELAMMLDVTGSMCSPCSKLEDLKIAAKDAVDILISDNPSRRSVRIGLAPYSAAVNAGPYARRATDGVSVDGCVFERSGRDAYTDTAPRAGAYLNAMEDPRRPTNGHYGCPPAEVLPITDDKSLLNDTIDSYNARGWTAGHLGIAWSWYLVSPEWSNVWPGSSKPVSYDDKDTIKAVILMTDGKFNTSYENGRQNRTSTNQAINLCENMKDENVIVFAVAFQAPSSAKDTLRECATASENFFDASNGDQLRTAFQNIAVNLANLRLSQ